MSEIRVAQVGCGYWGKNLARNFAEIGALGAVVDGNPQVAAAMSAQHGAPALSLDEVLSDSAISGVALATPAETHSDLARRALSAGKHVYVEKPMALTAAECWQMIAAANASGKVLMVGHLLQYHPIFVRLRELVAGDEIGTARYIYSNRLSLGKFRVEEDVLWSFAPHDVSMLLAIADAPVSDVTAQGTSYVTPGLADAAMLQIGFEGGLRGHVFTSWSHPFKEQRLVVIGDEGMAVFEDSQSDWNRKLTLYRHRISRDGPVPVPVAAEPEYVIVPRGEPLKEECREFVAAIAEGRLPRTHGAEGLAVIDVLERATAAMRWA